MIGCIRILAIYLMSCVAQAADQVLIVGSSLPLTGPLMEYGLMVKDGLNAAFLEAVRNDNSLKKQMRLEFLDDGGDPQRAEQNVRILIEKVNVDVLVGCVGEAVCAAMEKIASRNRVPLLGVIKANVDVCRDGAWAYCFHASYRDEAEAISRQLKTQGIRRAQLWVSPELEGYQSRVIDTLKNESLAVATYIFDSAKKDSRSFRLSGEKNDEAFLLLLNTQDAVAFHSIVRQARSSSPVGAFSSIEPYRWLQKTQGIPSGVFVTHSMPNPDLGLTRLAKRYLAAMSEFSEFNLPYEHAQVETYVVGRMLIQMLRQGRINRQSLARAIAGTKMEIDDLVVDFRNGNRALKEAVNLSIVARNGVLIQ